MSKEAILLHNSPHICLAVFCGLFGVFIRCCGGLDMSGLYVIDFEGVL